MALDGIFLHFLCGELNSLIDTRIEKIYQPSRDELVLVLRSAGKSGRLLISAKSGFSRLQLISETPDNPADPPTFCRLMRKYIGGAKITGFRQQGLDRTVFIDLSAHNEMGDTVHPYLAVELFTGRANIILCEESGRIIDAIHRSDLENATRLILPGAKYTLLPSAKKLDPFLCDAEILADAVIEKGTALAAAFMSAIDGVSPLISRELALLSHLDGDGIPTEADRDRIAAALTRFKELLTEGHTPTLILTDGAPTDFSYMAPQQYGDFAATESDSSYNSLLGRFYDLRDRAARLKAQSADIGKLLGILSSRCSRRLASRLGELEKSRDREELRIFGELLKANLWAVPKGADSIEVQNYYDPEFKTVRIPLDPAVSPAANASKFFKDYKKAHTAEMTLTRLIEEDKSELRYLESVTDALSRAETAKDISQIREELFEAGYSFRFARAKKPTPVSAPKEYRDPNGFRIAVGKNNRENDILTLKTASKEDIWLHVKDIPGSHVIIFTGGKAVPEETLVFAARLAALHSKAAGSENVPVDMTLVKYVKKPSGAKPGMVIYTHQQTLYVTP